MIAVLVASECIIIVLYYYYHHLHLYRMWSECVPDHLRTVSVIQSQYVLNLGAIYMVNC